MSSDLRISQPSKKQLKLWDDTRAALMWYCPYFTHILYTLMKQNNYVVVFTDDSDEVPVAATDAVSIVVNTGPLGFFRFNLMERLFITAHEILHAIFNHIIMLYHLIKTEKVVLSTGKVLPLDEPLLQKCMDYVINAILVASNVGKMPDGCLYDLNIAKPTDSVLDVYEREFRKKYGGGQPGKMPPPKDGKLDPGADGSAGEGSFDVHLKPGALQGKKPEQAISERNEAEWKTVIQAAMEVAKAQGKLPGTLEMLLGEAIMTKVEWTDYIQAFFARKVGSGASDWRHADRKLIVRDIWAPARSGHGCELIVLGCDTSGSIWGVPKVMDMWFGIIGEILEQLRPKQVIAVWCDAAIGRVDEVEELSDIATLRQRGVPGGGGTSFVPVFDYIWEQRLEPDALVYLTDGFGTFPPHDPGYPVLWGGLADTLKPSGYPFGEVVILPKIDNS